MMQSMDLDEGLIMGGQTHKHADFGKHILAVWEPEGKLTKWLMGSWERGGGGSWWCGGDQAGVPAARQ